MVIGWKWGDFVVIGRKNEGLKVSFFIVLI